MARSTEISNTDDIIDSRDVIARIAELETELESLKENCETADSPEAFVAANLAAELWEEEEAVELKSLRELTAEAEGYSDWHHGETLIRESYFTEYQQEMCDDCGYITKDFPTWIVIDWEATSNNLRHDYTEVEFDGVTYLIR